MNNLPQAITLGRLLQAFQFEILEPTSFIDEILVPQAIQNLQIQGEGNLSLPHKGLEVMIRMDNQEIILDIKNFSQYLNDNSIRSDLDVQKLTGTDTFCINLYHKKNFDWSELRKEILIWAEREQAHILAAVESYTQALMQQLSQGKGFSSLQTLREHINRDVFLVNHQMEILAWNGGLLVPSAPISFLSPKRAVNLPVPPLSPVTSFYPGKWLDKRNEHIPLNWYPLSGPQGILGYLGIIISNTEIDSIHQLLIYKTATLFLFELLKADCVRESERRHHRDFLFDLLYNNFESLDIIHSRGKLWGWDFTYPHFVLVGEVQDFNTHSSDRELLLDLIEESKNVLRARLPHVICLERNDQIVMLLPVKQMLSSSEWRVTVEQLLEPVWSIFSVIFSKRKIHFGLGNLYESARFIHRSFQEAKSALELGRLINLERTLTLFRDLGIMRLIQKLDPQELQDFRAEILRPLIDFDKENNLSLEKTLISYFSSNSDLNHTASKLYLHPNTVRYRLKKAEELLSMDLSHTENQLNLYTALKIGLLKFI